MNKAFGLICAIVILAAGQAFAAKVTDVELSWQDGFTVARLDVQGAVRFSHQTEEAKDGKPYRVIVDVLSATHQLGQKNFFELPPCPVTKIRTSQYAVEPEQVVRVVFDMNRECVYQIKSDDKGITVSFNDAGGKSFASWSSSSWIAAQQTKAAAPVIAQTPAQPTAKAAEPAPTQKSTQQNQAINSDRLASLEGQSAPVQPTKAAPAPTVKAAPVQDKPAPAPTVPAQASTPATTPSTETVPAEKKVSVPAVAKPDTITSDVPRKPDLKVEPPQPMITADGNEKPAIAAKPLPQPTAQKPTVTAPVAQAAPVTKPSTVTSPTPAPVPVQKPQTSPAPSTTPADEPIDEAVEDAEPEDLEPALEQGPGDQQERPTARFRRSSTSPAKMKGTMVAEFPTRLVIKYDDGARRDPFATLIDETKQYNNPIERRIPNVEGIRLVGVIESETGNSALFEDKDGYGYILREGDKIQKGYCLRIQPDRVFFQIFEYGWSRTVALNLESE